MDRGKGRREEEVKWRDASSLLETFSPDNKSTNTECSAVSLRRLSFLSYAKQKFLITWKVDELT